MSNLIKAAEELEYVPKEDLIRMAESGDSRFPPYLVLSEIQRSILAGSREPESNSTSANTGIAPYISGANAQAVMV